MRRILFILFVCLLTALPSFSQSTTLTASHIASSPLGTLLSSGQLCMLPVDPYTGQPKGFENNGVQYLPQVACVTVTSGAITGTAVPDVADSNPSILYKLSVEDATGKTLYTFPQGVVITGTTFSLDTWQPTVTAVVTQETVSTGVSAPQGRCGTAAAIFYTATQEFHCLNQVWVLQTSSGGGSAFTGGTLTSALYLFEDPQSNYEAATKHYVDTSISALGTVNSGQITTALGYTPLRESDLTAAIATVPTVTSVNIAAALGYQPLSSLDLNNICAIAGCTMTGPIVLAADPASAMQVADKRYVDAQISATQTYVNNQIAAALGSTGTGTGGTGGTSTFDDGIGTDARSGSMSDGTIATKTCYVGGTVCSGGVGNNPPASTPTKLAGQSSPNAATGTSNAVAVYTLSTVYPKVGTCYTAASPTTLVSSSQCYTEALWTTTGGGLGADTTSTNWARDLWVKAAFPAGTTNIEFDTFDFDGTWDFMWGTECEYGKYIIQYDNQGNGWVDTAIPCAVLYDGNYHHIQQTFHRDLDSAHNCASSSAPCEWWDDIWIDGKLYVISKSLPATSTSWSGSGGQIQLDIAPTTASSSTPAVATLYVDTDTVSAGNAESGATGNPGGNGGGTTSGTGELASYNFDSGIPSGLTDVGTPTLSTSHYHSSPNSVDFPAGNNYYKASLAASTTTLYSRQYVYITSYGSNSNAFLRLYAGGTELMSFFLSQTSGTPSYYDQASAATTTISSTPLSLGTIHLLETYVKISATAGQVICKIDGTTVYTSATTLNTGTASVDTVWFGQVGNTAPVGWGDTFMDNVDFSAVGWIGPI